MQSLAHTHLLRVLGRKERETRLVLKPFDVRSLHIKAIFTKTQGKC